MNLEIALLFLRRSALHPEPPRFRLLGASSGNRLYLMNGGLECP